MVLCDQLAVQLVRDVLSAGDGGLSFAGDSQHSCRRRCISTVVLVGVPVEVVAVGTRYQERRKELLPDTSACTHITINKCTHYLVTGMQFVVKW